jgi:hypothetical protein
MNLTNLLRRRWDRDQNGQQNKVSKLHKPVKLNIRIQRGLLLAFEFLKPEPRKLQGR